MSIVAGNRIFFYGVQREAHYQQPSVWNNCVPMAKENAFAIMLAQLKTVVLMKESIKLASFRLVEYLEHQHLWL